MENNVSSIDRFLIDLHIDREGNLDSQPAREWINKTWKKNVMTA